uniref:G_PROTEIN_RECEP_F1_2 domain-containing protein n=1 Tax=Caenorhabditis japonica TaxID=281687 RepID=A0A8R1HLD3_CAEJA
MEYTERRSTPKWSSINDTPTITGAKIIGHAKGGGKGAGPHEDMVRWMALGHFGRQIKSKSSGKYSFTYAILNMLEPFAWALPHQATIWTLIYITVFRVNIVIERRFGSRYVLSRKLTLTVCLVCASPVVISEFIRTMELHLKEVVDPDEQLRGCNAKLYELENRKFECKFEQVRSLLGVVMAEVIPCSILLISTIFLISELNGNHLISSLETQKRTFSGNRTLVIFLIFFLSTEIPLMFIFGVGIISEADFYALDEKMYIFEDCFIYLCMSFGYLQYCVMSSYYRDAVCSLVGRSKARNSVGTTRRIMSECNQTPPAILT